MTADERRPELPDGAARPVRRVLVTGASGYIGGRLVSELLAHGHQVRCVARTPRKLDPAPWRDQVEVVRADIADDLTDAMADGPIEAAELRAAVVIGAFLGLGIERLGAAGSPSPERRLPRSMPPRPQD